MVLEICVTKMSLDPLCHVSLVGSQFGLIFHRQCQSESWHIWMVGHDVHHCQLHEWQGVDKQVGGEEG